MLEKKRKIAAPPKNKGQNWRHQKGTDRGQKCEIHIYVTNGKLCYYRTFLYNTYLKGLLPCWHVFIAP